MLNQNVNNRDLEMGLPANERKNMNNKFDELAKGMAQSVTRRAALKKFGIGLAGLALACFGLANAGEPQGTALLSGKAVEDLTGNGITADDAPIGGRVIRLFRDNGDLLFNAGIDALVKTDTTK